MLGPSDIRTPAIKVRKIADCERASIKSKTYFPLEKDDFVALECE